MNANLQFKLRVSDLEFLLAVVRGGSLAVAAERLAVDSSTVFRTLQRIERGVGQPLFLRYRSGYVPTETTLALVKHAERMEAEVEAARSLLQVTPEQVSGNVRITTTDTVLHALVAPLLKDCRAQHPLISFDLHTGNEPANLMRRDVDIAIRATKHPPDYLVGKRLGAIRVALYAHTTASISSLEEAVAPGVEWIAPDEALPEHPSVLWRKRHFPKIVPSYRVSGILTAADTVALGMGVAILPLFLAQTRTDLKQISDVLDECQTDLWLLTHPESRHLRRVSAVYNYLAGGLVLV